MAWNIDSDLSNSDWPKRHWDFYGPIERQADMVLSGHGTPQENFDNFMHLPVARAMPDDVRGELRRRGYKIPSKADHATQHAAAQAKAQGQPKQRDRR